MLCWPVLKRFVQKYRGMSPSLKAGAYFVLCNCIQRGIQFLMLPLYTRLLSTAEYGTYTIFLSWFNILSVLGTLNVYQGVFNNAMLKFEDDRRAFLSSMQTMTTLITLVVFSLLVVGLSPEFKSSLGLSTSYLVLMCVQTLCYLPLQIWCALERFEYRYRMLIAVTVVMAVATPLLMVGFIRLFPDDKAFGAVVGYVIAQSIPGLCIYVFNAVRGKCFFKREYWGYALKFNVPLIPHYLSVLILNQADRIMIGYFCGNSDAGIYSLAFQIALALSLVTTGINSAFVPWTYEKLRGKNVVALRSSSTLLVAVVAVAALLLILIAPELILIAGGPSYAEAAYLMPPIVLGAFFTFVYTLFVNVEFYFECNKLVAFSTTAVAILKVLLNVLTIPRWGYFAASYTTFVAYLALAVVHFTFMVRIPGVKVLGMCPYDTRKLVAVSVLVTLSACLFMLLYPMRVARLLLILIFGTCLVAFRKKLLPFLRRFSR